MTPGHQEFVTRCRRLGGGTARPGFVAPDGVHRKLGRLTELVRENASDHVWQLLDWAARGDVVIVEWQATRMAGGRRLDWRGIDKFRLRDGRIAEERVYMDMAALRAARALAWPEPPMRLD